MLTDVERELVEATIDAHCRIRGWTLHAVNCRSNHVHVVVTTDAHPDHVHDQLKAWCTRRLKEYHSRLQSTAIDGDTPQRTRWWSEAAANVTSMT